MLKRRRGRRGSTGARAPPAARPRSAPVRAAGVHVYLQRRRDLVGVLLELAGKFVDADIGTYRVDFIDDLVDTELRADL